jgi:single-strand DNA-binding protein
MKERNVIQLIGYVGAEPASKTFDNGNRLVRLRIATHEPRKRNEDGKPIEYSTCWHTIVAWGDKAVFALNNFITGSRIMIDGKLVYRTYADSHGHKRYITEIVAYSLINLDR